MADDERDPLSMLRWPRDFMPEAADRVVVTMRAYQTAEGNRLIELRLDDDSVVICGGIGEV